MTINPCPFCSYEKPKLTSKRKGNSVRTGSYIQVLCGSCKSRGPIYSVDNKFLLDNPKGIEEAEKRAIEAWNYATNVWWENK